MYQLSNSQNLRLKRDLPQIYAYSSKIAFSHFPGMTLVKIPHMLNDFHLPSCRTNLRKFSVSFQGPTYYNTIENDIKESNSLHLFKTKLKKKLYMNY